MIVSQRISSLLGGVSQQSDSKKFPNQFRDLQNSFSDPTFGLIKRPGCQFVFELKTSNQVLYSQASLAGAKWFSILRDETEKYLCCIKSGSIYVWDLLTGTPKTVTYTGSGSSYLTGTTSPRDYSVLSINDYTFITNRKKTVSAQTAPSSWVRNRAFISVKAIVYNSSYNITINSTAVSYSTGASGSLKIADVTNGIVTAINGIGGGLTAYNVGAGVFVTGTSAFSIVVAGGQAGDALEVFQQSVPNVSKLPSQCVNGYTVLVSNTSGEEDDYYVTFVSDSGGAGPGIWQETRGPLSSPGVDTSTMPHQLVRNGDGTFTFGPATWEDRLVGDDKSNPQPSFVGVPIRQLFFYRNRLGVLTSSSIAMSQSGDYLNFYGQSALSTVDSDPIDLNISSVRPTSMLAVQPSTQGLLIFGSTEQFILTTSTDSLTPSTASITSISRYQVDSNNDLADLGVTTAFIAKGSAYTRVFELETLGSNFSPFVQDLTKQVPEWIPANIDQISASGQNSMMALASSSTRTVHLFSYMSDGQKRLLEGWSRWVLSGKVNYQVFDGDVYWCLTAQEKGYVLQKINLVQSPNTGSITTSSGLALEPRLDMWTTNTTKQLINGDDTKIYLPYSHDSSFAVNILVTNSTLAGQNSPNIGTIFQFASPQLDAGGYYVVVESRDLTNDTLVVGYNYTFSVELPTFYYRTGDNLAVTQYSSYLAVSRIKFDFGLSGDVGFTVKAVGRSDWSTSAASKKVNYYKLNDAPFTINTTYTLPVHQRSENFTVLITSDSPFPVALNSYTWEGHYSNRFYTRK
jgi:hypothetical protein